MKPLYGLVPAGGRSRRMGQPKETFSYHDRPETDRVFQMLQKLTEKTFYSIRPDQARSPLFDTKSRIIDRIPGCGPLGALWTAFRLYPGVSWLFVPIDMPFLVHADLKRLTNAREDRYGIVAYRGGKSGFLPLPAVYEAELTDAVMEIMGSGLRAILELGAYTEVQALPALHPDHLSNINTSREKEHALEVLHG